jgi:hypothetical protein
MLLRALAVWCALLVVAFLNGALRVLWITPAVGVQAAHIISCFTLSVFIALIAWQAIAWLHPATPNEALLIGDEWVLLTIAFEFVAGYYLFGTSWNALLAQYNVARGELWELVLVTMLVAPVGAAWGHHLFRRAARSSLTISSTGKRRFGR